MARLSVIEWFDLPIREASGLCCATFDGVEHLVAIGDADTSVAWTPLVSERPSEWQVTSVADIEGLPDDLGQFEAVADAGDGRLVIMGEEPALVVLIDPRAQRCDGWWRLVVREQPDFAQLWDADENSRGEAMILLPDGHILVIKEKRPVMAVEYGPSGRRSLDRSRPASPWEPPAGHELPVAHWADVVDAPGDLSDCVAVGGRIVAVSDQDRCLVVLDHSDETLVAGPPISLGKKIEKPEGLAVTASGTWFVAMDTKTGSDSLVTIEPPAL